jgi:hypothetical protein
LSNALTVEGHPCLVLEEIIARYGADLIFTYSRYRVAPSGLQGSAPRTAVLKVAARDLTPEWLGERFAELSPDQEMAWHSWVEHKGVAFHIPMIDFIGRPGQSLVFQLSRTLTGEMDFSSHLTLFDTGRSFHGYFADLIPEHAWLQYLGLLLVFGEQNRAPIIDTRWVGHALVRGFTALRWSRNTNRYRAMPHLMSVVDKGRKVTVGR